MNRKIFTKFFFSFKLLWAKLSHTSKFTSISNLKSVQIFQFQTRKKYDAIKLISPIFSNIAIFVGRISGFFLTLREDNFNLSVFGPLFEAFERIFNLEKRKEEFFEENFKAGKKVLPIFTCPNGIPKIIQKHQLF